MEIIPILYKTKDEYGDFNWMIRQSEFDDILFIFNDNEEYHYTNKIGKGNAIIRYYNNYNKNLIKPRSAGIPTGNFKNFGYKSLNIDNKKIINDAINEIKLIIKKYKYKKIAYSADEKNILGTLLFKVDIIVLHYITLYYKRNNET